MTHPNSYSAELARQRERMSREQLNGLDLFGWAERPAAERVEQGALPIPGATIQGRWEAWLASPDGARAFGLFCQSALAHLDQGRRISAKAIWETVRDYLQVPMNNSFTALAAREAETRLPVLKGQFEKRRRMAA